MRKSLAVIGFLVVAAASLLILNCIRHPNGHDKTNNSLPREESIKRIDVQLFKHPPMVAAFERRFGKTPDSFSVPSTHFAELMGHFRGASVIDPNQYPVTAWAGFAILEIEYEDRPVKLTIFVTGKAIGAFKINEVSSFRKFRGGSDEEFIGALVEAYAAAVKE